MAYKIKSFKMQSLYWQYRTPSVHFNEIEMKRGFTILTQIYSHIQWVQSDSEIKGSLHFSKYWKWSYREFIKSYFSPFLIQFPE